MMFYIILSSDYLVRRYLKGHVNTIGIFFPPWVSCFLTRRPRTPWRRSKEENARQIAAMMWDASLAVFKPWSESQNLLQEMCSTLQFLVTTETQLRAAHNFFGSACLKENNICMHSDAVQALAGKTLSAPKTRTVFIIMGGYSSINCQAPRSTYRNSNSWPRKLTV